MEPALQAQRERIRALKLASDDAAVAGLLAALPLDAAAQARIGDTAAAIVSACRLREDEAGTLDAFLHEFALTSEEGVALLCLAESLLRVPDAATADELIAARIAGADWAAHLGHSQSLFVNASTWALMLTGRVIRLDPAVVSDAGGWFARFVNRAGEPLIRRALTAAMRILGSQFVTGDTIEAALRRTGETPASFDMLGEAARTDAQAERYCQAYAHAIEAVTNTAGGQPPESTHGVSVKLSALDPRYEEAQRARVMQRLYPRLKRLADLAARGRINFTLDAEEADRLELSLDLFERLAREPGLAGWPGLGLAVQAYQKRAPAVTDWVIALARATGMRFMVRLVKGAYWDTEIKHAQVAGLMDYPVYTRKAATDVSYLVCAARLLAAGDAVFPQFATHNAHTIAAVLELAGGRQDFEFQRLHGMGALLYAVTARTLGQRLPLRVYAPVGSYAELLPYLVRRLLENGANSSFVNRFLDRGVSVERVTANCVEALQRATPKRHPAIPLPEDLYTPARRNSSGIDLADRRELARITEAAQCLASAPLQACPIVGGHLRTVGPRQPVHAPADRRVRLGEFLTAGPAEIEAACALAARAQPAWDACGAEIRAGLLVRAADAIEAERDRLMGILIGEAGRTCRDAADEIREAADYCRYYAAEAERLFARPLALRGPIGERNELTLQGRGVFACISPWNFPLAIFTGQIAAALAAGNAVLAKPAEQTPLIASVVTRLFHTAGVPPDVLHLLPGNGETGAQLVATIGIDGVAFTGSVGTAQAINRALAAKPGPVVPLIAETGGQNAMIVDSTALLEVVADDVIRSAYHSAGQRCSALRVLLVQEEVAEPLIALLAGAIDTLVVGDPADPATDVGPLIDEDAQRRISAHLAHIAPHSRLLAQHALAGAPTHGIFTPPVLVEFDDWSMLREEVFGPVVHLKRFRAAALDDELRELRATGYGLTLGLHSRIEARAHEIARAAGVGNVYVNRNMIGAVVGVQPFGGRGLSGTGPKAGGPHTLLRFAVEQTLTVNTTVTGANAALFAATSGDDG